jgi:DNA sulfur modification protein DndC
MPSTNTIIVQHDIEADDFIDLVNKTRINMRKNFLADGRPWVVAYSGGKDSTLTLQLVYELLLSLPPEDRKPVYVIASDTRVEAPIIADYVSNSLNQLEDHAKKSGIDVTVHLVQPEIDNSFWTNIIGKGYPPPNRWFRWCTSKLKIKPIRLVVDDITAKHGSVILLLGSRKAESGNRSRSIERREYNSRGLNPHHEIPNALVMQPIVNWTTEEVWEYLFTNNPAPWGISHDRMLDLYRQANSNECPVVTDLNTPACGGSRFGCWTCTVVSKDKSMAGFISSGDEWMTPLYDFRNWLKEYREDESTRNVYKRNGQPGLGPFKTSARQVILEKLLDVERKVNRELISDEKLIEIQRV